MKKWGEVVLYHPLALILIVIILGLEYALWFEHLLLLWLGF